MSLDSPATYAEWYWKHSVDAMTAEQEAIEKEMAGVAARLISTLKIREYLPEELSALFNEIVEPSGAFMGGIGGRFVSEVADGAMSKAASPFFESMGYMAYQFAPTKKMTPVSTAVLYARKKISEEFFLERFRMGGYEPHEAEFQFDSMRPYPSIPDLITWARYHGDPDNIRGTVWDKFDVHAADFELWEWLGLQRMTTLQAQTLLKRGALTEGQFFGEIARIGWHSVDREAIRDLSYMLPNAMLMVQGNLVAQSTNEKIIEDISKGDIHPAYAQQYLDAVLTKPASQDIVAYELRKDPDLSNLERELKRIGIHPAFTPIYKTLAYQIPPVADIITMAVREAFTPAIAARFGQYEDFPSDLEKYAGMKGLSKEWAERYWAAHWNLPSPQQGFEMLHRGVINDGELNMLLRAQDVMPFWRDRLTAIAYRPLTRVDVRRMYKQGVLDEREVFESYLDAGYNDKNAERMAEFTVRQTLATLSKFTSGDIVKAFANRMISRGDAKSLLREIGIRSEDAEYIVSTAEYKRIWAFTDDQISGIRNLYRKRMYDENQARDKLSRLNLPSDQINVLMEQWYYEKVEELDATWTTAQTIKFLKRNLITTERAKRELNLIGYDAEHIDVYMKDLKWTPPKE